LTAPDQASDDTKQDDKRELVHKNTFHVGMITSKSQSSFVAPSVATNGM
jgi:hypothetical protein